MNAADVKLCDFIYVPFFHSREPPFTYYLRLHIAEYALF